MAETAQPNSQPAWPAQAHGDVTVAGSCRIGRGGVVDAGAARRRGGTRAWALSTRTDAAEAGGRGGVDPGVRAPYQPPDRKSVV